MPSGTKILCWREKWHSQRWDFVWVFNFDTYFHFKRKAIRNVCFTFFSHFPIRERFFKFPGRFHYKFDSIFHFVRVYYDLFLWCLFLPSFPPSLILAYFLPLFIYLWYSLPFLSLSVNWWHSLFYIPSTHYLLFIVCVLCTLVWLPEIYVDCTIIPRLLCNILIACLII